VKCLPINTDLYFDYFHTWKPRFTQIRETKNIPSTRYNKKLACNNVCRISISRSDEFVSKSVPFTYRSRNGFVIKDNSSNTVHELYAARDGASWAGSGIHTLRNALQNGLLLHVTKPYTYNYTQNNIQGFYRGTSFVIQLKHLYNVCGAPKPASKSPTFCSFKRRFRKS